jgi:hypothetical protein
MVKLRFFVAGHLEGGAVKILAILLLSSNPTFAERLRTSPPRRRRQSWGDEDTHLGNADRGFGASVPRTIDNFALHPETFDDADWNIRPLSRERQPEVRTERRRGVVTNDRSLPFSDHSSTTSLSLTDFDQPSAWHEMCSLTLQL